VNWLLHLGAGAAVDRNVSTTLRLSNERDHFLKLPVANEPLGSLLRQGPLACVGFKSVSIVAHLSTTLD
jgi:hypothetical protein